MNGLERNRLLAKNLYEVVQQHEMGLITDIELLCKAVEVGTQVTMPKVGDIDPNTGLRYEEMDVTGVKTVGLPQLVEQIMGRQG